MQPNVVWIYGEDLYPNLACYGTPVVATPNIDRLAAEGTRYENAFVTCPVCSPSRSAIITGRYQTSFGAHNHRSCRDVPLSTDVRLVTDHFRDAGYFTCNSSGPPDDRPGKTDFNFARDDPFDGVLWSERAPGQPFYQQLNITDTHRDFTPDPERPIDPDAVELPPYYPDHPLVRKDWAMWLESIQVFDRKVGQVLRRLDDDGLTQNTIVFLISDHGRAHIRDKQFLYDGGIRVPCIVRWPGHIEADVVRTQLVSGVDFAPTALSLAGLEVPSAMEGVVFAGPAAQRRDWVAAARDRCDGTVDRIRCVRTERYKYIRNYHPDRPYMQFNGYKLHQYPLWTLAPLLLAEGQLTEDQARFLAPCRPAEELYDLQADPHELNNLADIEAHASRLTRMRATMDGWMTELGDHGAMGEEPMTLAAEARKMHEAFGQRMAARGLAADIPPSEFLAWWEQHLLGP
jgi:uncharacterized sulfatase